MNLSPDLTEVNSISRSEVYSQFGYAPSNASGISKVSVFDSINSVANNSANLGIKPIQPLNEWFSVIIVMANENFSRRGFQLIATEPLLYLVIHT